MRHERETTEGRARPVDRGAGDRASGEQGTRVPFGGTVRTDVGSFWERVDGWSIGSSKIHGWMHSPPEREGDCRCEALGLRTVRSKARRCFRPEVGVRGGAEKGLWAARAVLPDLPPADAEGELRKSQVSMPLRGTLRRFHTCVRHLSCRHGDPRLHHPFPGGARHRKHWYAPDGASPLESSRRARFARSRRKPWTLPRTLGTVRQR